MSWSGFFLVIYPLLFVRYHVVLIHPLLFFRRKEKFYYLDIIFQSIMNIRTSSAHKTFNPFFHPQMTQLCRSNSPRHAFRETTGGGQTYTQKDFFRENQKNKGVLKKEVTFPRKSIKKSVVKKRKEKKVDTLLTSQQAYKKFKHTASCSCLRYLTL